MAKPSLAPEGTVRVTDEGGVVHVVLTGDLTSATISGIRASIEQSLPARISKGIALDLAGVTQLDASGVSIAVFLSRLATARALTYQTLGANKDRELLVDLALRGQELQPHPPHISAVRVAGIFAIGAGAFVVELISFIGEMALVVVHIVKRPKLLRMRDTVNFMARHGTDAVPVVGLLGLLIGAIIAFQTFDPLAKYGAKLQVADVVAISIVRELGPLITAIILAGRSGSAFAAEIGTMKVTQELDALRTFGIDPVRFLVIPRLLAVVIVTPLLSVYASILGVFGGYLILGPHGFTGAQYMDEVRKALTIGGFLQGLAKAAVFAILVASIGCLAGLRTGQGPGAVGMSTTRAVVAGIVAIVVADSVLGAFFYTLGI
ncbi:MAG: ABC transporter permease [Planctomycetota bacterium]|nr:MAG: ABC transporter permease [Planctomycetota bacterium]